jgi:mono/diheme cytochrome c family protein
VTEIPEHLLKRSKERRSAIGGGDDAPAETAPAGEAVEAAPATAPAAAAAAVAVPEPVPVPEPMRPEVAAALSRRKIPFWAMPVLAALPLWAYVYQATLEPAPTGELTPLEAGAEIYATSGCGSCHGAGGAGQAGIPGFAGVNETWPDFRDHMMWVRLGSIGWFDISGTNVYGANQTASTGGVMPAFPALSDQELAEVILYERVEFGGMEETGPEYEALLAIAEGTATFADAGLGELSIEAGIPEDDLTAG